MIRRPHRSTRTDTHFPYTTLFRSIVQSFLKVMELCTAITRLFTARNQVLNGVAAPFGLTAVQVMALHHISAAPACTPSTLARSLAVDSASVTRLLDRLEHKDMIQRAARSAERRVGKECVSTCKYRWK